MESFWGPHYGVLTPRIGDDGDSGTPKSGVTLPDVVGPGAASVFLNTNSGPAGSTIRVSGTGFAANEEVVIRFHTDEVGSTTANDEGKFENVAVTVPASYSQAAPFQFSVIATGRNSLRSDLAPFTVSG